MPKYLAELPPERRTAIEAVRKVILKNLDKDFEEGMSYGMIGYYVPHSVYPAGYHCNPEQPMPFAALASQKQYMSLYLMGVYGDAGAEGWLRAEYKKRGMRLDMGKACIRFKKLEELPLDVVGEHFRRTKAKDFIAKVEASLAGRMKAKGGSSRKKPAKKAPPKKSPTRSRK